MKCVEICLMDDGSYSVGECEPDSENLQPVGSLQDAMMQAAEILQGSDNGDAEGSEMQQEAFEGGFNGVRGGGA